MKAYLRSVRIAPKKANLIAMMVRGMPVPEALELLQNTHKKGARFIETLLRSAVANAEHNEKQRAERLKIAAIVVNQGTAYQRGTPMARGRMRPMKKFMSHIALTLGVMTDGAEKTSKSSKKPTSEKTQKAASNAKKAPVESKPSAAKKPEASSDSSVSSASPSSK